MNIVTKDRNGYGNDTHCVLLTYGSENITGDPSYFIDSSNGSNHTCYLSGNTSTSVEKITDDGVFDKYCWSITGHTTSNWGYIKCNDNLTDWDFGQGDFCIDYFLKPIIFGENGIYGSNGIYVNYSNFMGFGWDNGHITNGTGITFIVRVNGTNDIVLQYEPDTFSGKNWYHIAVSRKNNDFNLYFNGELVDTDYIKDYNMPSWGSTNNEPYLIGAIAKIISSDMSFYSMTAQYDNFRISKGNCRWSSSFTLPNRQY